MKNKLLVIPLLAGVLAFTACSSHSSDSDRGGAATGRIDSGSSSMPGDHNAVGTDSSDSMRSRGGSTSGSGSGSSSGSMSGSGTTQ